MITETEPLRLSQLAVKVDEVITRSFAASVFWVIADVTNHSFKSATGYHFFDLVEKISGSDQLLAKFAGRAWGSGTREIEKFESATGHKFTNNIQVLVAVKVEFHSNYGIQLQLAQIDPTFTLGVIEQQRQQTLERLLKENPGYIKKTDEEYWTKNKSLPLPLVLQRIAVISSKGSAGLQDFEHTLGSNHFGFIFDLAIYFTGVQGESNAGAMRATLIDIYNNERPYDLVVIIRGGGSQTDFLIFDHYLVGQAIARFPVPVVTGIGHHKNITIADLMAHTAVKTPTKAAEFIIEHNRRFEEQLVTLQQTILIKVQQGLAKKASQLEYARLAMTNQSLRLMSGNKDVLYELNRAITSQTKTALFAHRIALSGLSSLLLKKPQMMIAARSQELKHRAENLNSFQAVFLKNKKGYLNHYVSLVGLVSPENTLKRGFALVKQDGRIISDPASVAVGTEFTVVMRETELNVLLKNKRNIDGNNNDL